MDRIGRVEGPLDQDQGGGPPWRRETACRRDEGHRREGGRLSRGLGGVEAPRGGAVCLALRSTPPTIRREGSVQSRAVRCGDRASDGKVAGRRVTPAPARATTPP